jgi:hypothetical protein
METWVAAWVAAAWVGAAGPADAGTVSGVAVAGTAVECGVAVVVPQPASKTPPVRTQSRRGFIEILSGEGLP